MAATYADEAFERLYARYAREVYRYALALLRNPTEAEDVTQTTFLNAYRALRAGERPRRPHNWLIAIAHNACRSRVRFAMRRPKEVPLDDVVEQLAVAEADRPNIRELVRTIGRLPFNQRVAITMRELEGRSYVDIAERLGVTVPAAEALIRRARRTLREQSARFRVLALLPSAAGKVAALLAVGAVGAGVGIATGNDPAASSAPAAHLPALPAPRHDRQLVARRAARPTAVTHSYEVGRGRSRAASSPRIAVEQAVTSVPSTATATSTVAITTAAAASAATTVVSQLTTLTTPAATTPAVTTPVATVPPVTVPTLTVPTVTVPPLP